MLSDSVAKCVCFSPLPILCLGVYLQPENALESSKNIGSLSPAITDYSLNNARRAHYDE